MSLQVFFLQAHQLSLFDYLDLALGLPDASGVEFCQVPALDSDAAVLPGNE